MVFVEVQQAEASGCSEILNAAIIMVPVILQIM